MAEKIKIFALGGIDENGKECTVVEIDNDIFVVNCGLRYPDRTMPGIDYIIPQYDYLKENKSRIKAYFLLHGHDDSTGGLAYVYRDAPAPIFGSKVTLTMFKNFTRYVGLDQQNFDFHPISPSTTFKLAGRKFTYFHMTHNIAEASGLAIETEYGNIVFTGDYVIENNATLAYLYDAKFIAKLAEEPTLVLLSESVYANKTGYTAPKYKLTPFISRKVKDAQGRVYVSLFSDNFFNIDELISVVKESHKKIICYDDFTENMLVAMQSVNQLLIPKENYASRDDLRRLKDSDIVILMTGFGGRLFRKLALLASCSEEDHRFDLKESDTFIVASPADDNTEIEATDAIDALFRTGCDVLNIKRKEIMRMHASEEDLKSMLSIFQPKFYLPIRGYYKEILANCWVAMGMGIGLKQNNIINLSDNGTAFIYDGEKSVLKDNYCSHGDLMIDGLGVGDIGAGVIEDRKKLSEGVVILACTISKKGRKILAGPDVQMRGFVFLKDADNIVKEVTKTFISTTEEFLKKPVLNLEETKQNVYERCLRLLKRMTGKEPMVLPLIIDVE